MAENNLLFTLAPKLVELLKECAADPKTLSSVSLTPAAYKLTYGVSDFFKTGIIESKVKIPLNPHPSHEACFSSFKSMLIARFKKSVDHATLLLNCVCVW